MECRSVGSGCEEPLTPPPLQRACSQTMLSKVSRLCCKAAGLLPQQSERRVNPRDRRAPHPAGSGCRGEQPWVQKDSARLQGEPLHRLQRVSWPVAVPLSLPRPLVLLALQVWLCWLASFRLASVAELLKGLPAQQCRGRWSLGYARLRFPAWTDACFLFCWGSLEGHHHPRRSCLALCGERSVGCFAHVSHLLARGGCNAGPSLQGFFRNVPLCRSRLFRKRHD